MKRRVIVFSWSRPIERSCRVPFAIHSVQLTLLIALCALSASAQKPSAATPNFSALSAEADRARDSNRLDDAVVSYKKALDLRPTWAAGWWSLGTILYDQNAYAEAADSFRKVVALAPKDGTAWVMLGLCEVELGQDASALEHLEHGGGLGIAKDPQLQHVMLYHEGALLLRKGRFEAATEAFDRLCSDGVANEDAVRALGMSALRMPGKSPPAAGPVPAGVIAQVGRAECLAAQDKFDDARQSYRAVVSDHPEYPNIHYAYGKFLLELHETAAATEEFEQEIKNNPRRVMARLEIAAVKYRIDSAAGVPYAEEAVKLDPQLPFGHYLLGLLLVDTKRYPEAIRELEIARPSFSGVANLYYALGTAYSRTGRKQDAARAWAMFARLNREAGKSGPLYYGQKSTGIAQEQPGR
ncbi:MAG: tetratricopeptide repeat protein [Terriglobia bacterium]